RQLWDMIVHAIVRVLQGELQLPVGWRIWWCLASSISSMPLHAAGPYRRGEANLNQIYVSSYAPTLAALVKSRRGMQQKQEPRSFSAISQADLPTAYLSGAVSEANLVKTLIPEPTSFVHLSGQEATRKMVLEAPKRHDWVYSARHRQQDIQQPYKSYFEMDRREKFTLLDLIDAGEFAFLSACHTAQGDKATPDEAIHLAAGLQFAGFKSVIGTLW
ncbi:CHAT domain-containing protein, partial [Pisolithus croceorrhizus]